MQFSDIYPASIGIHLGYKPFSLLQLSNLKRQLPDNFLISCDGLTGVGKGTLCTNLASLLDIEVLDTGLLYRALTYAYEDQNLELNPENTLLVIKSFKPTVNNGKLKIEYKNKLLETTDLKNLRIDICINKYNKDIFLRGQLDIIMKEVMVHIVNKPFIADLRGSSPSYIMACEESGLKVIRLLLYTDLEIKVKRRFGDYLKLLESQNPFLGNNKERQNEILADSKQAIIKRDTQDIESILETGIGLIHEASGVIDTTNLSIDEAIETALWYIAEQLCIS